MSDSIKLDKNKVIILQKKLKEQAIDIAFLSKNDARYFIGIKTDGCVIIPKKNRPIIFLNKLELDNFNNKINSEFIIKDISNIKSVLENKKIGLNHDILTANQIKSFKNKKDISKILTEIKQQKSEHDIKCIRKSCKIAQEIIAKTISNIGNHLKTEYDIYQYLKIETAINDCELAFDPIVASGKRAAIPHAKPSKQKLAKGFLVIDFGVKYEGYCSDISRTIYVGNPSKKEIELYDIVLKTQVKSIKHLKNIIGRDAKEIDKYARKILGEYESKFIHGLGHGVGLDIHEPPFISSQSNHKILPGQIITIEPGIYDINKKYGIRIEDDILIKEKSVEILTNKLSKDLIILCNFFNKTNNKLKN